MSTSLDGLRTSTSSQGRRADGSAFPNTIWFLLDPHSEQRLHAEAMGRVPIEPSRVVVSARQQRVRLTKRVREPRRGDPNTLDMRTRGLLATVILQA